METVPMETPLPPPPSAKVLNTASLIVGPTRSGKSSLLATAAEYIWETYGKVSNYVLVDGGGFPAQMQALVNVGVVRLFRARTRNARGLVFETLQRAAQGWWPEEINPETGEVKPHVRMIPPVTNRFTKLCPNGHVVLVASAAPALQAPHNCPTCKLLVGPTNMTVTQETHQTPGFELVGGLLFDGLTSACAWMMEELSERAGRSELGGEKSALGTVVSGDMSFGGSNRAMYGAVQARAEALVLASNSVPNLVIPPIWTALTHEMSDEGGMSVRGPLIVGNAKTTVAPQWFGDIMETAVVEEGGKKYRRLYLQTWVDEKAIRHLCGVRSFPGTTPLHLEEEEDETGSQAFTQFSLGTFYRMREAARVQTEARYRQRFANAPGLQTIKFGAGVIPVPVVGEVANAPALAAGQTGAPAALPAPAPGSPAARARAAKAPAAQPARPVPVVPAPISAPVAPAGNVAEAPAAPVDGEATAQLPATVTEAAPAPAKAPAATPAPAVTLPPPTPPAPARGPSAAQQAAAAARARQAPKVTAAPGGPLPAVPPPTPAAPPPVVGAGAGAGLAGLGSLDALDPPAPPPPTAAPAVQSMAARIAAGGQAAVAPPRTPRPVAVPPPGRPPSA